MESDSEHLARARSWFVHEGQGSLDAYAAALVAWLLSQAERLEALKAERDALREQVEQAEADGVQRPGVQI